MLSNINLNLLRSLHVLLDECHVSRAAERLHITQSAMSRQLAQLRELCGDPLLVRDGNRLVPTARALTLQSKLLGLLDEFEHLFSAPSFVPEQWQGEFVFASSDYVAQYIFPAAAQALMQQAPRLNLSYRLWQPSYLTALLDSGIHLASTMLPQAPRDLSSVHIGQDSSVCLMRADHPLAQQSSLSLDAFLAYSHIKVTGGGDKDSATDRALGEKGLARRIALQVPFFTAAVNCLLQSDHLMVVPKHIAVNLAKNHPLVDLPLPLSTEAHQYWLMWHPKYDSDLAHRWAREVVLAIMLSCQYSIGMISDHYRHEEV